MSNWESFWLIGLPILVVPTIVGLACAWLILGHNPLHRGPCPPVGKKEQR